MSMEFTEIRRVALAKKLAKLTRQINRLPPSQERTQKETKFMRVIKTRLAGA